MTGAIARRGEYQWSIAEDFARLVDTLLSHHRNARLFVTSFDSGPLVPRPDELVSGWTRVGNIAVSPPLTGHLIVPSAGFDEWYIFDEPPASFEPEIFVNYVPFPLGRTSLPMTAAPRDEDDQRHANAVDRFWRQLDLFRPLSYVARAESDVVVSRDQEFIRELSRLH